MKLITRNLRATIDRWETWTIKKRVYDTRDLTLCIIIIFIIVFF